MGNDYLQAKEDERRARRHSFILRAVEYALEEGVGQQGGRLTGLSVRLLEGDTLLTLRAEFDAGPMVGFVGSSDLGACLVKAVRELEQNRVQWRESKF